MAVDPENRLVARSLEGHWNEKLAELQQLEREQARREPPKALSITEAQRERILALAQDFPTLWRAETTTNRERKHLLRLLIKDVTLSKEADHIAIGIRWQSEAVSTASAERPKPAYAAKRTDATVVAFVREKALRHTDEQISELLNQAGFKPGQGGSFTRSKVKWVRYAYRIETACPEMQHGTEPRGDGRYSTRAAAALLNVDISTVMAWCKSGQLDGLQRGPDKPWWIRLTPRELEHLRKPVKQRWSPRTAR
jgi:hypothetical protein